MHKLVFSYHITKTGDYDFKLFQKIKIIVDEYEFRFKIETVVDIKTLVINYDFDNMIIKD